MDSKLPDPQNCLVFNSANSLYVYRSGNQRDTYYLIGKNWTKSATSTNANIPTNAYCQPASVVSTGGNDTLISFFLLIIIFLMVIFELTNWFRLRGQR